MKEATHQGRLRPTISLLLFLFLFSTAGAQELTIQGTVKDKAGQPVESVTVQVEGTAGLTTLTDATGAFRLAGVQKGAKLIFSNVGFQQQEIVVQDQQLLNIVLTEKVNELNNVVVIGYGAVRKKDLTGSVSSVSSKELQAFPNATVAQALQGRAAGVQVQQNSGQPGAGIQVRIRGTNSIRGDNEPLWIIDGFPGNANMLNTNDIESIEILKDASATAIYGSRGANGVVIVSTKKGKAGVTRVDYSGNYSVQTVRKKLDLLNAQDYMRLMNIQQINDNGTAYFSDDQIKNAPGTDWQDLLLRNAGLNDHNISVYGGTEKTKFSISAGIFDQQGIVRNNDFQRINIRGNIDQRVSDKVSVFMNVLLNRSTTKNTYPSTGLRGNSVLSAMLGAPPTVGPYLQDGAYRLLNATYPFVSDGLINPIANINEVSATWKANRVALNSGFIYKPVTGLSINVGGNLTNVDARTDNYTSTLYPGSIGSAGIAITSTTELNGSAIAEYTKTFLDKHKITVTAGTTADIFVSRPISLSGTGFLSNIYETDNIGAASTINTPSSGYTRWTMLSYLGRINYTFNNRLLLTASVRADGSSRYSAGNKWGYFPSGAIAYRLSEEDFLKESNVISDMKIRFGYGETGSTAIDPYYTLDMLNGTKVVFNDALYNAFSPGTRLPGSLKWETTAQSNIGIDLAFFSNRIRFTADYYIKTTKDLLNSVQLPRSLGYETTIQNIGELQNKGLELSIDADVLDRDLRWNIGANISFNRNKVSKLYNGQDILGSALNVTILNDNLNLIREGQPLSIFYGYVEDGYTSNGKIKYKDLDGSGTITTADKTYIGNPNPKFTFGFNSTMSWRNFDLSLFVQGVQGNDIFSLGMAAQTMDFGQGLNTLREVYTDHWTPETPNALYPKISRTTTTLMSDRYVYDGSFVRLKNLQLAYRLPAKLLGGKTFKSAQVYVSGQNLLTFTDYPWYDPEINTMGGGASLNQGIDHYAYPVAKTVSFGIKLGL